MITGSAMALDTRPAPLLGEGDLVTIGPSSDGHLYVIVGKEVDSLAGTLWLCAPLDVETYRHSPSIPMSEMWIRLESSLGEAHPKKNS